MDEELLYWVGLHTFPKFGPRRMTRLRSHFPSMKEAFYAPKEALVAAGIPPKVAESFIHLRADIQPERTIKIAEREQITIIPITSDDYPSLLKTIYDPPSLLFVRGHLPPEQSMHLAVVGSRKATQYGIDCTKSIISKVAAQGIVVVSGLAYGIDEAAHIATVKEQGTTIAVLGTGLCKISSRSRYLADRICEEGGAIVSEFPLEALGQAFHFPFRNRVIAGLSQGTLVVEAQIKSGSLITAKAALEQGREVFAIPGSIFSETSEGTNHLIKQGAHPVTSAEDILDVLGVDKVIRPVTNYEPANQEEAILLEMLSSSPIHIDELTRSTSLHSASVGSTLSLLEIKGRVQHVGGQYYVLGG